MNWMEWENIAAVNFAGTRLIDSSRGKKLSTYGRKREGLEVLRIGQSLGYSEFIVCAKQNAV